jgi:hypothetical protein
MHKYLMAKIRDSGAARNGKTVLALSIPGLAAATESEPPGLSKCLETGIMG